MTTNTKSKKIISLVVLLSQVVSSSSVLAQSLTIRVPVESNIATQVIKSELTIGNVKPGISGFKDIIITNDQQTDITITDVAANSELSLIGGTCQSGVTLTPGSTCTASVLLTPASTTAGNWSSSIGFSVKVDTSDEEWIYKLNGTSTAGPLLTATPADTSVISSTTKSTEIALENTNDYSLIYSQVSYPTTDLKLVSSTCSGVLLAGSSCSLFFRKTKSAGASGSIKLVQSTGLDLISLNYSTGTVPQVTLISAPSYTLDVPTTPAGVNSFGNTVFKNTGTMPATILVDYTGTGNTVISNNCTNVAVGSTCTIVTGFDNSSLKLGSYNGTFTFNYSTGTTIRSDNSTARVLDPTELISLSSSAVDFGQQLIGSTTNAAPVTITNIGNFALTISSLNINNNYFKISQSTCTQATLKPNETCSFVPVFAPTTVKPYYDTVTILSSTSKQLGTVNFYANSVGAVLSSPSDMYVTGDMGTSSSLTIPVTNSSSYDASIASIGVVNNTGPSQWLSVTSKTCGATLPANTSCSITVQATGLSQAMQAGIKVLYNNGLSSTITTVTGNYSTLLPYLDVSDISCQRGFLFNALPSQSTAVNNMYSLGGRCTNVITNNSGANTAYFTALASAIKTQSSTPALISADLYNGNTLVTPNVSLTSALSLRPAEKLVLTYNFSLLTMGSFTSPVNYALPDGQSIQKNLNYLVTYNPNYFGVSAANCPSYLQAGFDYMCTAVFTNSSTVPIELKSITTSIDKLTTTVDWSKNFSDRLSITGCSGVINANSSCNLTIKTNLNTSEISTLLNYGVTLSDNTPVSNKSSIYIGSHKDLIVLTPFDCTSPLPGATGTCIAKIINNYIPCVEPNLGVANISLTQSLKVNTGSLAVTNFAHNCKNGQVAPGQSCDVVLSFTGISSSASGVDSVQLNSAVATEKGLVSERMTQQAMLGLSTANVSLNAYCPQLFIGMASNCVVAITNNSISTNSTLSALSVTGASSGLTQYTLSSPKTISPLQTQTINIPVSFSTAGTYTATVKATINGVISTYPLNISVLQNPSIAGLAMSDISCLPSYYYDVSTSQNGAMVSYGKCYVSILNTSQNELNFNGAIDSTSYSLTGYANTVSSMNWYDLISNTYLDGHSSNTIKPNEYVKVEFTYQNNANIGSEDVGFSYTDENGAVLSKTTTASVLNPWNAVSFGNISCTNNYVSQSFKCTIPIKNSATVDLPVLGIIPDSTLNNSQRLLCNGVGSSVLYVGNYCEIEIAVSGLSAGSHAVASDIVSSQIFGHKLISNTISVITEPTSDMGISKLNCTPTTVQIGKTGTCTADITNKSTKNTLTGLAVSYLTNDTSKVTLSSINEPASCTTLAPGASCRISFTFVPKTYFTGLAQSVLFSSTVVAGSTSTQTSKSQTAFLNVTAPNVTSYATNCSSVVNEAQTCSVLLTNKDTVDYTLDQLSTTLYDSTITTTASSAVLGAGKSVLVYFTQTGQSIGTYTADVVASVSGYALHSAVPVTIFDTPVPGLSVVTICPTNGVYLFDALSYCTVTVKNNSPVYSASLSNFGLTNTNNFTIDTNSCGTLAPNGSCMLKLPVNSGVAGPVLSKLNFTASNASGMSSISMIANLNVLFKNPEVALSFVNPPVQLVKNKETSTTVRVSNISTTLFTNIAMNLSTAMQEKTTVVSTTCSNTLLPNTTCDVTLSWIPSNKGNQSATATFSSDQVSYSKTTTYVVNAANITVTSAYSARSFSVGNRSNSGNFTIITNTGSIPTAISQLYVETTAISLVPDGIPSNTIACKQGVQLQPNQSCWIFEKINKILSYSELSSGNTIILQDVGHVISDQGTTAYWNINYELASLKLDVPKTDIVVYPGLTSVSGTIDVLNKADSFIKNLDTVIHDPDIVFDKGTCSDLDKFNSTTNSCKINWTYVVKDPAISKTAIAHVKGQYPQVFNQKTGALQPTQVQGYGTFNIRPVAFNASWSAPISVPDTVERTSNSFTAVLTNNSQDSLPVSSLSLAGVDNSAYQIITDNCTATVLTANQSCTVTLSFIPTTARSTSYTANLIAKTAYGTVNSTDFSAMALSSGNANYVDLSVIGSNSVTSTYNITDQAMGIMNFTMTNGSNKAVPSRLKLALTRNTANGSASTDIDSMDQAINYDLGVAGSTVAIPMQSFISAHPGTGVTCYQGLKTCDVWNVIGKNNTFVLPAKSSVTISVPYSLSTAVSMTATAVITDANFADANSLNNTAKLDSQLNPYDVAIGSAALSTQSFTQYPTSIQKDALIRQFITKPGSSGYVFDSSSAPSGGNQLDASKPYANIPAGTYEILVPIGSNINQYAWNTLLGTTTLGNYSSVLTPDVRGALWGEFFDVKITPSFANTAVIDSGMDYHGAIDYFWESSGLTSGLLVPKNRGYASSAGTAGLYTSWPFKASITNNAGVADTAATFAYLGYTNNTTNKYVGPALLYKMTVPHSSKTQNMSIAMEIAPKSVFSTYYTDIDTSNNKLVFNFTTAADTDVSVKEMTGLTTVPNNEPATLNYLVTNTGAYPVTGLFKATSSESSVNIKFNENATYSTSGAISKTVTIGANSSVLIPVNIVGLSGTAYTNMTGSFVQASADTVDTNIANNATTSSLNFYKGSSMSVSTLYSTNMVSASTLIPVSVTIANKGSSSFVGGTLMVQQGNGQNISIYTDSAGVSAVPGITIPSIAPGSSRTLQLYARASAVSKSTGSVNLQLISSNEITPSTAPATITLMTN